MATDIETTEAHEVHAAGHEGAHHPSNRQYWMIFWILFAVTAVEVGLYYFSIPGVNINNAALGILAAVKFVTVVGFFMHLKFDSLILRRLFMAGLVLAVLVYLAVLLSMGVFLEQPGDRNKSFVSTITLSLLS